MDYWEAFLSAVLSRILAADWQTFFSAVLGGVLVIAGDLFGHWIRRRSERKDKKYEREERIASLAMEVVNWLASDQQVVFAHSKSQTTPPPIELGNPVYSLAAAVRKSRPDLKRQAAEMLAHFQAYSQTTRVFLPTTPASAATLTAQVGKSCNVITNRLNEIIEAVCK